jgi:hypothetical protein
MCLLFVCITFISLLLRIHCRRRQNAAFCVAKTRYSSPEQQPRKPDHGWKGYLTTFHKQKLLLRVIISDERQLRCMETAEERHVKNHTQVNILLEGLT